MSRIITKELGLRIVKKLEGQLLAAKSKAHDIYGVYENAQLIARISIRRGSEKDKGHDHIQRDLNVPTSFAKGLAQCPKSRGEWIGYMRENGHI